MAPLLGSPAWRLPLLPRTRPSVRLSGTGRARTACRGEVVTAAGRSRRVMSFLQTQKVGPRGLLALGAGPGQAAWRGFPVSHVTDPGLLSLLCSHATSALGPQASASTLATVCGTARRHPWPPTQQGLLMAIWTIASDTQPRPQRRQQPRGMPAQVLGAPRCLHRCDRTHPRLQNPSAAGAAT